MTSFDMSLFESKTFPKMMLAYEQLGSKAFIRTYDVVLVDKTMCSGNRHEKGNNLECHSNARRVGQ